MSAISGLDNDSFSYISLFFTLNDLSSAILTTKVFHRLITANEHLWKRACHRVWEDKVYVPSGLRSLAQGVEHVEQTKKSTLSDIKSSNSVKELKMKLLRANANHYHIQGCYEKSEFVNLLFDTTVKRTDPTRDDGSEEFWMQRHTYNPFSADAMIEKNVIPFTRFGVTPACSMIALKLSIIDSNRTNITFEELQMFTFNVRCRMDGPFTQLCGEDPWWLGAGFGKVNFLNPKDGSKMSWLWPKDSQGKEMNPFANMGMIAQMDQMSWELVNMNRQVQMFFAGNRGPVEVIARHPITWGWVLFSEASVWSCWEYTKEELNTQIMTRGIRDSDVNHHDPDSFYARSMAEMRKESQAGPW
ncbi:hypothetical protein TrLO_g12966 [Triparma laevis f. longispina]|uniref:F-box domain-containing protein n=1 Tax=Triparma laevis f. longispina TaxID=1714387 RepID=A0A9W7FQK7_9STRA|nr:hypothetical protein TrLO_g12966 [Triparma laevis f. longispina]